MPKPIRMFLNDDLFFRISIPLHPFLAAQAALWQSQRCGIQTQQQVRNISFNQRIKNSEKSRFLEATFWPGKRHSNPIKINSSFFINVFIKKLNESMSRRKIQ